MNPIKVLWLNISPPSQINRNFWIQITPAFKANEVNVKMIGAIFTCNIFIWGPENFSLYNQNWCLSICTAKARRRTLTFETDQSNRNLSIKFKDNSLIFDVSISINLVSFKFQFWLAPLGAGLRPALASDLIKFEWNIKWSESDIIQTIRNILDKYINIQDTSNRGNLQRTRWGTDDSLYWVNGWYPP